MRCWTWSGGEIRQGIAFTQDERLGQVVFLGESGRGRRYEKVALGKRNPAEVVNGRVLEAHPVKVTLPAKDEKPEKVFYVLEKPRSANGDAVLVRVYTYTAYIRNGRGYWQVIAGKPETLITGYGAFGDAGRIGNWDDGLVVMRPGDVLKVFPSRGIEYALWLEKGKPVTTTWKDYENIQAVEKAQELIAEAAEKPKTLNVVFGQMPTFTWSGGQITKGLKVMKGATGPVIAFGESGRGRCLLEVPLVGFEPSGETAVQAAVVRLDEKVIQPQYSWEKPEKKIIYGLTQTDTREDAFLVRVCTGYGYTRRGDGYWETWKGSAEVLTLGWGADGDAGRIGSWKDGLVVLREGDVLYVRPSGDGPAYALYVRTGQVYSEEWTSWKVADSRRDPTFYVDKGTAPWGHVPSEWIGSVVTVLGIDTRTMIGNRSTPAFVEEHTGELIFVSPNQIVLNLGWDGRDRHDVTVAHGTWVRLDKDKQVRRLEGEELAKRQALRKEAETLREQAHAVKSATHFAFFADDLQESIRKIAGEDGFDIMASEGWNGLGQWIEAARRSHARVAEATTEAISSEQRQGFGEILVRFEAWHRRGGMTSNGDGWVIRSDGTLRKRDSDDVRRHKSDGTYRWDRIAPEELALRWSCGHMGDVSGNSKFEVAKLPMGGPTSVQLQMVRQIEEEIGAPRGAFGLDPAINARNAERLAAIREAASKILKTVPEFSYYQVAGQHGIMLENGTHNLCVDWSAQFNEMCDGRPALLVRIERAAGGELEFLAYDKYGQTNFAMRWRELPSDELLAAAADSANLSESTADKIRRLQDKFRRD